ncbi:MAG: aldolase [Burkholderiales bacterium]|nr:aldolase [Burkholderiales bacterium]
MSDAALRNELCRVGRSLHARGYVHGTTGNISARVDGGFLITATDACLGELEPEALVRVDAAGMPVDPAERPSKTLALHRRIYAATSEAGCVIHTHSTHLVRASLAVAADEARDDLLPPITPYFVMKVGHLPLIAYRRPGAPEVGAEVAAAIVQASARGAPIRAVMLSRLGPNVWHETPAAAMAVLEECEETARLWLACEPKPAPLSPAQIDELRRQFGARW